MTDQKGPPQGPDLMDAIEVDGSLAERDCEVRFIADGRALAVATIGRDRVSLGAEAAMERELEGPVVAGQSS